MKTFLFGTVLVSLLAVGASAQSEVNARRENQQDRIANGVKSGELTPAESARLEKREAELKKQIKNERSANGGKLTPKERAQIEKELNEISRKIHRQKNDAQKTPPAKH